MAIRILNEDGSRVVLKDGDCAGCPNAGARVDRLSAMFEVQKEFENSLGVWSRIVDPAKTIDEREALRQQFVNQMLLAMFEETVEVMRETKYKNPSCVPFGWKKGQELHKEKLLEEMVDLWHFMMNVLLAYEFTAEEFHRAYFKKMEVNIERQKKGY